MKLGILILFSYLIANLGCGESSAGNAQASGKDANEEPKEDTATMIDLNSGEQVRLHINLKNDIATNVETGEIVRIYVNPATKDTFDGLNGRIINHAIMKTAIGTYGVDMTKVKLEDKPSAGKRVLIARK